MNIELTNLTNFSMDEEILKSLANFALKKLGIHPDSELSISLVDEDEMSSLHMRWLNESGPTDVLSFPMDELKPESAVNGPGILGDIVLCRSLPRRRQKVPGKLSKRKLNF